MIISVSLHISSLILLLILYHIYCFCVGLTYIDAQRQGLPLISRNDEIALYSDRSYKQFEQVFINYGEKSNADLLLLYGFSLDRNPSNAGKTLTFRYEVFDILLVIFSVIYTRIYVYCSLQLYLCLIYYSGYICRLI